MPETRFEVRRVRHTELNDWYRLRSALWDEASREDHQQEMADIIADGENQLILVAESDDRIMAFLEASIRPFAEDCESENVGYLEGWYVEPEFRKLGVGRELVRNAEDWAKTHGAVEMASDAEIGNDESIAAHAKLGFEETSRLVHLKKDLV